MASDPVELSSSTTSGLRRWCARATRARSRPSTSAITPRCWRSAAACSATVRTARTRCRRPSCARTARCVRAGRRTRCGRGCSRSPATAAARCLRRARGSAMPIDELEPGFDGLADDVRRRAELRELVADLGRLPDDQREALVLFELGDLSHAEIAATIGCPTGKVKALVFQARTTLIAERDARGTPCEEIREQLEVARGGVLRRGPLRRHVRQCEPCRAYGGAVARRRASARHRQARRAAAQAANLREGPGVNRTTGSPRTPEGGVMLSGKTLFAALALTAAGAVPAGADAGAPDRAPRRRKPAPARGVRHPRRRRARLRGRGQLPRGGRGRPPAAGSSSTCRPPRPSPGRAHPSCSCSTAAAGTGEQFLRISGWREQADATGLVAVFPTGLRYRVLDSGRLSTKWNDYSLASQVDLSERPSATRRTRRGRRTTSASSTP